MRRRAAVVVAAVVAVVVGAGGIALALSTTTSRGAPASTASASAAAQDGFGETDYCYVEAMIYYRSEAVDLAGILQNADGVSDDALAIARGIHDEQGAQLDELRETYLAWKSARPLERTDSGPCAGHADHSAMVGLPGWSELRRFSEASGADAEQQFAELMIAQNAGVTAFCELVLEADPNDRVTEAATAAIAQATREDGALRPLLP